MFNVKAMFEDRIFEVGCELMKDSEYKALVSRGCDLFNRIKAILPEECRKLMMELDEIEAEKASVETDFYYSRAFADGIEFYNQLKMGGK